MGRAHLTGRLRRPRPVTLAEGFSRRNFANLIPPLRRHRAKYGRNAAPGCHALRTGKGGADMKHHAF